MARKWLGLLGLVVVTSLLIGCGGTKDPAWILKGAAAFPGDEGKYIYGVGVSVKSRNPAMMREKGDHRARVEIARTIKTYIAVLTKDFMEEWPDYFDPDASGSEEYTMRLSKEVSEATLHGCQIYDRYQGKDGTFYSLARLDKDWVDNEYKAKLRAMKGMLLRAKTEQAIRQLDKELNKVDMRQKKDWDTYFHPSPAPELEE